MSQLTKRDAQAIARKLGAIIDKKRNGHEAADVFCGDKFVVTFGIRRGRPGLGHDHIPETLPFFRKSISRKPLRSTAFGLYDSS